MIDSAQAYHTATSYDRHAMSGHVLNWANYPQQFKTYPHGGLRALPDPDRQASTPLWSLWQHKPAQPGNMPLSLPQLSKLLMLGQTITAQSRGGAIPHYYRSSASAGALYPNEIYVAAHQVRGLPVGLYHYDLRRQALVCIRAAGVQEIAAEACFLRDYQKLDASLFFSGIFFRSAWKYRARAYRYVLLDAGHILSNFLLALRAMGLDASWHLAFDDARLEALLGVDAGREGCFACIHLPGPARTGVPPGDLAPLDDSFKTASQVADHEIEYTEIRQIHTLSKEIVFPPTSPSKMAGLLGLGGPTTWQSLNPKTPVTAQASLEDSLLRRRSRRNFIDMPLASDQLHQLVSLVAHQWNHPRHKTVNYSATLAMGLWIKAVEDHQSGFYLLDPTRRRMGLVKASKDHGETARFCLNQRWLENGAVYFVFMANLAVIDQVFGPRGYRYAMLAAGEMGQTLYLGATALGLGCCGIGAFYDQEARRFLGLNTDSALLYLVAVGPIKHLPSA